VPTSVALSTRSPRLAPRSVSSGDSRPDWSPAERLPGLSHRARLSAINDSNRWRYIHRRALNFSKFATVHMSAFGPKLTCESLSMSAFGGKADEI
jgi:hypothetical protein